MSVVVLLAAAIAAGCGALASAQATGHRRMGILSGEIRAAGAVCPRGGCGPKAGRVTVFTPSGRVIAHQHVGKADHFRFRFVLPPGSYELNAGHRLTGHHLPADCPPSRARVQPDRTTRMNVHTYCRVI